MQIVVYINTYDLPHVTVFTHFEKLVQCHKKLDEAFKRQSSFDIKVTMKKDEEQNSFLEIDTSKKGTISYLLCKESIFYNK